MNTPQVYTANPLQDIFPDSPISGSRHYALHMVRGEEEGFLIGVRAGDQPITRLTAHVECSAQGILCDAHHIGLVPFSKNTIHIGSRSVRAKAPGLLPEYYTNIETADVPADESHLYISAVSLLDAAASTFEGTVALCDDGFSDEIRFTLIVYPVTNPSPTQSSFTYIN